MSTTGSATLGRVYVAREANLGKTETAYIGMGANVGDTSSTFDKTLRALAALPGATIRAVSPFYRSKPVGGVVQADFLNAVVELEVPAGPDAETGATALLLALKQIETALGRQPRQRWGPRELDLDLLLFGDHRVERHEDPWLVVPHPEMANRQFVLAPMADLSPALRPPGWSDSVADALTRRRQIDEDDAVTPAEPV
jgi:2-amino-4-hydroxy-6-hydroxymethyldihydropteridine diphosphokinase